MRLLEFFTILTELDRLSFIAQQRKDKIVKALYIAATHGMANVPNRLQQKLPTDSEDKADWARHAEEIANKFVGWVSESDPSSNKKYTDWIVRQFLAGKMMLEDVYKMDDLLQTFEEYRKGLTWDNVQTMAIHSADKAAMKDKNFQDINTWKDYRILAAALRAVSGQGRVAGVRVKNYMQNPDIQQMMQWPVPDPVEAFGADGSYDLDELRSHHAGWAATAGEPFDTYDWYDTYGVGWPGAEDEATTTEIKPKYVSDRVAVLQPNTQRASCYLGKGTQWCTAADQAENYFWSYAPDGPMYIILTDKDGKFQWHFESGQFADAQDEMLNETQLEELVSKYPELQEAFEHEAKYYGKLWLMDVDAIDRQWIEDYIRDGYAERTESVQQNVLFRLPKAFDGQMEEDDLQMVEDWIRKDRPHSAHEYIRRPTKGDLTRAIAYAGGGYYNNAISALDIAARQNMRLPDDVYERIISQYGHAIFSIPTEILRERPEWVQQAMRKDHSVIERALSYLSGTFRTQFSEPYLERIKFILNLVPHETMLEYLNERPHAVPLVGDKYGMEPWYNAFDQARGNEHEQRELLSKMRDNPLGDAPLANLYRWMLTHDYFEEIGVTEALKTFDFLFAEIPENLQIMTAHHDPHLFRVFPEIFMSPKARQIAANIQQGEEFEQSVKAMRTRTRAQSAGARRMGR